MSENMELKIQNIQNMELFLRRRPQTIVSTLAKVGNMELVEKMLSEKITFENKSTEEIENIQLYMASFWGDKDAVRALLSRNANVNYANPGSMWTPLHAATFNEHGPIVMFLLATNADPMSLDYKGRTPVDFASASDILWPHFGASGYQRTPRGNLIDLEVLESTERASSSVSSFS